MTDIKFDSEFVCEQCNNDNDELTQIPLEWDVLMDDCIRSCVHCFYQTAYLESSTMTSGGQHTHMIHREQDHYPKEIDLYTKSITSIDEASMWILAMHRYGKSFHWDDNPFDIVNEHAQEKLFTNGEAILVRTRIAEVCNQFMVDDVWDLFDDKCNINAEILNLAQFGYQEEQ